MYVDMSLPGTGSDYLWTWYFSAMLVFPECHVSTSPTTVAEHPGTLCSYPVFIGDRRFACTDPRAHRAASTVENIADGLLGSTAFGTLGPKGGKLLWQQGPCVLLCLERINKMELFFNH